MGTEATAVANPELDKAQRDAVVENEKRTGIGTRVRVGQTRGRNPLVIKWESFDESQPTTLPTSIENFMDVTKVKDQNTLLGYLITGYNESNYIAASDPLSEFINDAWPPEAQAQFRLVVRNYSRGANVTLEDAVGLIKPGFEKQFAPK